MFHFQRTHIETVFILKILLQSSTTTVVVQQLSTYCQNVDTSLIFLKTESSSTGIMRHSLLSRNRLPKKEADIVSNIQTEKQQKVLCSFYTLCKLCIKIILMSCFVGKVSKCIITNKPFIVTDLKYTNRSSF